MKVGANFLGNGRCMFRVWAPWAGQVQVHFVAPIDRIIPLSKTERGYHQLTVDNVVPECLYFYKLGEGKERPDPASRSQPQGVHGPS